MERSWVVGRKGKRNHRRIGRRKCSWRREIGVSHECSREKLDK
jgi:hypothetical protein